MTPSYNLKAICQSADQAEEHVWDDGATIVRNRQARARWRNQTEQLDYAR